MIKYQIFDHPTPDFPNSRSFGILAVADDATTEEIKNISTNQSDVEYLIAHLTNYQVSLMHFKDVVEDFCQSQYEVL